MGSGESKVRAAYNLVVDQCPVCGQTHYYPAYSDEKIQHCRATAPSRRTAFSLVPAKSTPHWTEPKISDTRYHSIYPTGSELTLFHGFKYTPSATLPFYYENKRTPAERVIDEFLGMGQDGRQIFSNLYPSVIRLTSNQAGDKEIFLFPHLAELEFASVENIFQASKCCVEGDAKFVAIDLTPVQAASYGQAKLTLNADQRRKLIEYGMLWEVWYSMLMVV